MFGWGNNKDKLDASQDPNWERDLLQRLSMAALHEQRRARRWGIFFKLLIFSYLFLLLFMGLKGQELSKAQRVHSLTAVVDVHGLIADSTRTNADTVLEGVRSAFADARTRGIILRINSPGGSPVQSDYIFREIRRLSEQHPDIPVHAVIGDIGASGAYYIAAAAENIYVNPSSIVGSIGVLMNSFGFVDTLDKLGVERRLMTAGENKGILDPFLPMPEQQRAHLQGLLDGIHAEFIEAVRSGRGDRLADDPTIFSGLFWGGRESIELGLADGIGDVDFVAREVIGEENVVDFTPQPDLFRRFAERFGSAMATVFAQQIGLGQPNWR